MSLHKLLAPLGCLTVMVGVAWFAVSLHGEKKSPTAWQEVAPSVLRSPGSPAGYALVAGDRALLIDAPDAADKLKEQGIKHIDGVLLTHHHRDSCAAAGRFLASHIPVRAPKASAPWLLPDGVRRYWRESLPLRGSRTAYLVLPEGLAGVDCSLVDGQTIDWRGWTLRVVASPGHSMDHVAFAARKGTDGPLYLFCGDALASAGKMWTPYTTDWDHWTDAGLKPAAASLRKLAALEPSVLLPAHGDVIRKDAIAALKRTAETVEEMAFLKSFERYTKERLKNPPQYKFLAAEQAKSNGSKPWSRISEHLFLTGNTYVLVSKDNTFLVVDPWDPHSARQLPKLKADRRLGAMEVVLVSHAHYDHYDGIYSILSREKPEVWTLDHVAPPLADPNLLRAPFLDARPVKINRRIKDGETVAWREYRLRFRYLPGQTDFSMGVETTIDGKRCMFTADNFFHQDQFSGTGGWMGLNRSWPLPYAASAKKVLNARPEWVLAEHGGAFEFNAEDFRRRVKWGEVSARAADALCPSGNHRLDWDPSGVHFEPLIQRAKAGEVVKGSLVALNPLGRPRKPRVTLEGRGLTADQTWQLDVTGRQARRDVSLRLGKKVPSGRHVLVLRVTESDLPDPSDAFLVVDVGP